MEENEINKLERLADILLVTDQLKYNPFSVFQVDTIEKALDLLTD